MFRRSGSSAPVSSTTLRIRMLFGIWIVPSSRVMRPSAVPASPPSSMSRWPSCVRVSRTPRIQTRMQAQPSTAVTAISTICIAFAFSVRIIRHSRMNAAIPAHRRIRKIRLKRFSFALQAFRSVSVQNSSMRYASFLLVFLQYSIFSGS